MQRPGRIVLWCTLHLALGVILAPAAHAGDSRENREARGASEEREARASEGIEQDDPLARYAAMERLREGPVTAAALQQRMRAALRERDRLGRALLARPSARALALAAQPVQGNDWINLGPTSSDFNENSGFYFSRDAGRLRSVVPHPANPDILFVATAGGGVWKTYNGGTTWEPLTDLLPTLGSGALAMDPRNPDVLAYGFGDPFDAGLNGSGVVVSTDGGATWSAPVKQSVTVASVTTDARQVRDLAIDPSNSAHLLVATDVGVFTSQDFGATWAPASLPGGSCSGWSIGWLGEGRWLVSGELLDAKFAEGQLGLFLSTDGGATWSSAVLPPGVAAAAGRATIAVAPSTTVAPASARVYLIASVVPAPAGQTTKWATLDAFRSDDGGLSFRGLGVNASGHPTNPIGDQSNLDVLHDQSSYNQAILVDPLDPDTLFIGGNLALIRSKDGGATWSVVSDWLPAPQNVAQPYVHADFHAAAATVFPGPTAGSAPVKHFYFGSDGGLFRSENLQSATPGGAAISDALNVGVVSHLAYSIACADPGWPASLQGFVIGGLQDNGTRMRALPALHLAHSPPAPSPSVFDQVYGGDGFGVAASRRLNDAGTLPRILLTSTYGGTSTGALHASADGGNSWNDFGSGIASTALPFTVRYASDSAPNGDGETFLTFTIPTSSTATDGHIYRVTSASSASSWSDITGTVAYPDGTSSTTLVNFQGTGIAPHFLAADGRNAGHYAVDGDTGSVFATIDAGAHWTASRPLGTGADAQHAGNFIKGTSGLAMDWSDPTGRTLYVGSLAEVLFDSTNTQIAGAIPDSYGRLFKTSDGGRTWQAWHGSGAHQLPNVEVHSLKQDPQDASTVYVGTYLGLYVTHDGGATFDRMGVGLPLVDVTEICVSAGSGSIKVATYGRGFWEIDQHAAAVEAGAHGRGDLDYDQQVDGFDLIDLVSLMGTTNQNDAYRQEADLAGDTAAIDDADLAALVGKFGGRP